MGKTINKILLLALLQIAISLSAYSQSIDKQGTTIFARFSPPNGYVRQNYPADSFAQYLRLFPLKDFNAPVRLYDGNIKRNSAHISVFDMPLVSQDLIQCADAVMKLRAEYLYENKRYEEIVFTISNGMKIPFTKYAQGFRVKVSGNKTSWVGGYQKGYARKIFNEYLIFIYSYAGTLSLSRESKGKDISQIQVGDFFIFGGSPGHVVLVLDIAENSSNGKKIMLLGQSYMPSQDFHILKSFSDISPWYYVEDGELVTPEWTFPNHSLKSFGNRG